MCLVNYLADEFQKEQGIDLRRDKLALQRLKEAAETAKIELLSSSQTEINLPYITAHHTGPKHLALKLTRSKLQALVEEDKTRNASPVKPKFSSQPGLSLATFRRKIEVFGVVVNSAGQSKARRG